MEALEAARRSADTTSGACTAIWGPRSWDVLRTRRAGRVVLEGGRPCLPFAFRHRDRIDGNMLKVVGEITADVAVALADGRIGPD